MRILIPGLFEIFAHLDCSKMYIVAAVVKCMCQFDWIKGALRPDKTLFLGEGVSGRD